MNKIFSTLPMPENGSPDEYDCGRGSFMLLFKDQTFEAFELLCKKVLNDGFVLFDENKINDNIYRTFRKDITLHIYFCPCEKALRMVADPNMNEYSRSPETNQKNFPVTLWQFEVDHTLIDCGMCYIVRCGDGSFFVVDSAHMYSVRDDIRIIDFLKKHSGMEKPVVSGWFLSHAHDDHICKFMDVVKYHKNEIEIKALYYNFPPVTHKDSVCWNESNCNIIRNFEKMMDENSDLKVVNLHSGQHFFVGDLEFNVLCTHEDVFPNSIADFNDTSTALMMTACGTKVLFPGDCAGQSDKILVRRFGEYLKCDIVQVSHHGHFGTSPEFYRLADAPCALFPITEIKFDEELPRQKANPVILEIAKEYYIASHGTVEIPLPYKQGNVIAYPDETNEDFEGIFNLWCYEYSDERKRELVDGFEKRKNRKLP